MAIQGPMCATLKLRSALAEVVGPYDLDHLKFDVLPSLVLWYSCCLS